MDGKRSDTYARCECVLVHVFDSGCIQDNMAPQVGPGGIGNNGPPGQDEMAANSMVLASGCAGSVHGPIIGIDTPCSMHLTPATTNAGCSTGMLELPMPTYGDEKCYNAVGRSPTMFVP